MAIVQEILLPVARIFALMIGGFALFRIPLIQKSIQPFLFITLNIIFPFHFIHNFSAGWDQALHSGWQWMLVFFFACIIMMGIQYLLALLLVKKSSILESGFPREMIILFSVHNAGYIPLPLLHALVPTGLVVYMFFYFFAFNLVFWTLVAAYMTPQEGKTFSFKVNGPLIGIMTGFLLAAFDLYHYIPSFIQVPVRFVSEISLYVILFLVGAIIGTIPLRYLQFKPVFKRLILIKMVLFPLAVWGLSFLLPLQGLDAEMASGIRLALVIEAAVPPATNIMITAKAYGTEEQVHFVGSGIMTTYLATLVVLPVFVILSLL